MESCLQTKTETFILRCITNDDNEFLFQVFASTRELEVSYMESEEQIKLFLNQQFHAQQSYYLEHFSKASFDIVEFDGKPIGRLYVDRRVDEIRIIDIALLPEYRNRGLGKKLLQSILQEAEDNRLPVRIHVEKNNPALHLYLRLEFKDIEDVGVYMLMEWKPEKNINKKSKEKRRKSC